ncbi:tetratricopeptide repeat protein [Luteolibacter yonseiensis]|uniref:Tetratricopeptide repeat protein n=1 Tax=Luteolibacter yonseiensis TaxID=1144680 RepID=A0A934R0U3_9BACT|nr:tetratricopeptide repeat protein [Luteolibacter yonseiensis]MBK1814078.1 tetratricopeptide repeat protein [Luteolibacter yonseiensis]
MKRALQTAALLLAITLGAGSLRNPQFWESDDRRGDRLMRRHLYQQAAVAYQDAFRRGVAQYRDGQFEAAAGTFARVPGAEGFYNAANAWLMHGQYERAIATYDRALSIRPHWKEAEENKAIAIARHDRMDASGKNRDQESADAYDPDEIVTDGKGGNENDKDREPLDGDASDAALQATWLRSVKTTPAQFLKAKFAWQAQARTSQAPPPP